ncbi:PE-PPE domain-containing protein [Mycobacterium sp. 1423905.2]|uniref:PE family protein n=1 Tax=Mycobacterium sp. 1423905.2 TaxID=1856859 RepID=UPI0007FDB5AC|nr:PE-PPE domain-containing protein [Mycobacterium sp. 1423905.2]OBJ47825.1 PE family protein [Mycobacterium sp. 1423905.2]
MSYVVAAPDALASAAANVDGIAAALSEANAAAAGRTSGLLAAAEDEVSAAIAQLFNAYGQEYQAVVQQAGAFHSQFTQALAAAGNAYAQAEAAAATALTTAINTPVQSLLGPGAVGTGGTASTLASGPSALLANRVALIMGGTNNPLPVAQYVADINAHYIQPLFPGATPVGLPTPEQFWPVTPNLGNLTYNQSVAKGVVALHNAIASTINTNPVVAFGYSQSASIINNEIVALMAANNPFPATDLSFILAAAGNNPNGGLLARFPGFYIPFLDASFNGATPSNTPYPTTFFTAQYDGIAHVPQYPSNILADINALMGYFYVHSSYPDLNALNAVQLPTSPGYTGNTEYYMFLTQNLPLLQPIRDIPYAGPVIADLLQPPLRVMVDLGYNDYGYADLPTPASLINIPNPFNVAYYLGQGLLQAPYGAAVEIGVQAGLWGPEYFPDAYPWVPSANPGLNFYFGPALSQPPVTELSLLSGALGNLFHIIPSIHY